MKKSRSVKRTSRHWSIRTRIQGTGQRPRLCVFRSLKHMYAQLIDDSNGQILVAVSSLKLNGSKQGTGGNVAAAKKVGQGIAERALEKGFKTVVFDRGGYFYHGRVKALAEAARETGLKF